MPVSTRTLLLDPLRLDAGGATPSRAESLTAVGSVLDAIAPSDGGGWISMDFDAAHAEVSSFRGEASSDTEVAEGVLATTDHPMVRSFIADGDGRDAGPRRMSDIATHRQLRRTRAYAQLLHPLGIEHQVFILTGRSSARSARGWALNRTAHDFSDRELGRLAAVTPVLRMIDRVMSAPRAPGAAAMQRWGLTAREVEVLDLVATGLTAKAIGTMCGITERTVQKHLEHVCAKLGAHDKVTAVLRLRDAGQAP